MNAMTTTNSALANFSDGPDPFAAAAADMGAIQGHFLKFDGNSGDYTYGPEADAKELSHGSQLAVNFTTFRRGWICWKEGDAVEEIMVPILEGNPPAKHTLTDHGPYAKYPDGTEDGWFEQRGFELRTLDTGELLTWKGTSKSALRAFASILNDFSKVYRSKPAQIPVIEISAISFEPKVGDKDGPKKKIGKKYAPVLKIVGWIPMAEFEELENMGSASAGSEEGSEDSSNYQQGEDEAAAKAIAAAQAQAETTAAAAKAQATTEASVATGGRRAKRF